MDKSSKVCGLLFGPRCIRNSLTVKGHTAFTELDLRQPVYNIAENGMFQMTYSQKILVVWVQSTSTPNLSVYTKSYYIITRYTAKILQVLNCYFHKIPSTDMGVNDNSCVP